MKLADRINNALATHGLKIQEPVELISTDSATIFPEETVEPAIQFVSTFDNLQQMLKGADKIQPDEDGVRVVCVKNVGLKEMNLPTVRGRFIIDDIQRNNGSGYEVHLVENPLHERQT
jgi:hypothetical protein